MKTTKIIYEDYEIQETSKAFLITDFIDGTETIRIEKRLIEKLELDQEPIDIAVFLYQIEIERYNARTQKERLRSLIKDEAFPFKLKEILRKMSWEKLNLLIQGMNFAEMKSFFFEEWLNGMSDFEEE